jgi:N-acyl-D-aspartate/D-glutamate deacylase
MAQHRHSRVGGGRCIKRCAAGGKRLLQKAEGYRAIIVSGAVTYRDGVATGALPGRLVRGAQEPVAG